MYSKIISLLAVLAASFIFSGCSSKTSPTGETTTNVLGIVKVEEGSYRHVGNSTVSIETDEVVARENFSGNRYTFLWGLITIKDY